MLSITWHNRANYTPNKHMLRFKVEQMRNETEENSTLTNHEVKVKLAHHLASLLNCDARLLLVRLQLGYRP